MSETTETPLTSLADAAFRQATAQVIRRAKQTGTPLLVWGRDGLRSIPPEDAPDRLADAADLIDLREAKADEASSPTVSLNEFKDLLGLGQ